MIRQRYWGSEEGLSRWFRHQESQLPSRSNGKAFSIIDVDFVIHAYKLCEDGVGTREIQAIMKVEFKSRNGEPTPGQLDTLWKDNLGHKTDYYDCAGLKVRNFGWFVLSVNGTCPDDSDVMRWGNIVGTKSACIEWVPINKDRLFEILRFDVDPRTLKRRWYRRHHKTEVRYEISECELGFPVALAVKHSS